VPLPLISPGHKWWQTVLEIKVACSQWQGSGCSQLLYFGVGGGHRGIYFSCSQCVTIIFTRGSHPAPKGLAEFPICSQQHLNFIPHKVAFPCTQTEKLGSKFDSILRLRVQRNVSTGECPTFQKIGDGSINLAPSKRNLSFVSICHYLLQFLEPLIRILHHGIDKNSRQLIECVHFSTSTFGIPCTPPWPSHYKSKLHTPPLQLQSSPDSSSYTAFLAYQTPSSCTSIAGSIVFCLPGVKNIH
jgi:hypothetical protein